MRPIFFVIVELICTTDPFGVPFLWHTVNTQNRGCYPFSPGELLFLHLSAQTKWLRGGGGEASVTSSSSSSGHASAAVAFHGLPAFASLSDSGLCPRLFPPQALYFASSSSVCDAQDPAGVYEMVAE